MRFVLLACEQEYRLVYRLPFHPVLLSRRHSSQYLVFSLSASCYGVTRLLLGDPIFYLRQFFVEIERPLGDGPHVRSVACRIAAHALSAAIRRSRVTST